MDVVFFSHSPCITSMVTWRVYWLAYLWAAPLFLRLDLMQKRLWGALKNTRQVMFFWSRPWHWHCWMNLKKQNTNSKHFSLWFPRVVAPQPTYGKTSWRIYTPKKLQRAMAWQRSRHPAPSHALTILLKNCFTPMVACERLDLLAIPNWASNWSSTVWLTKIQGSMSRRVMLASCWQKALASHKVITTNQMQRKMHLHLTGGLKRVI